MDSVRMSEPKKEKTDQDKRRLHCVLSRCLKTRVDVLSFETGISATELVSFALERLCGEGEADLEGLVARVAQRKAERVKEHDPRL